MERDAIARRHAMGREHVLPATLGRAHRVHETPHVGIVCNLTLILVFAVSVVAGTPRSARDAIGASPGHLSSGFYLFAEAVTLSVPLFMLCYVLVSIAGLRASVRTGTGSSTRRVAIALGSLLVSVAALFGSLYYSFHEASPGAGIPGPTRMVPVFVVLVLGTGAAVALTRRRRSPDVWASMGAVFE